MSNNLFVAYDLSNPGQNYEQLTSGIKSLGSWARLQQSVWYINSQFTAEQARAKLDRYLDNNDKIIVIDAKNNSASWKGLSSEVATHMKTYWHL